MLFVKLSTALSLGFTAFTTAAPAAVPPPEDLAEWESPPFNPYPNEKRVPPQEILDELDVDFDHTHTEPVNKRVPPPEMIEEEGLSFDPTPNESDSVQVKRQDDGTPLEPVTLAG